MLALIATHFNHVSHHIGWPSLYRYTADLLCLDLMRPETEHCSLWLSPTSTPIRTDKWELALQHHPDRSFVQYLLQGFRQGFRIGFNHKAALKSAEKNLLSADHHPEVIAEYLQNEKRLGRMLGPFPVDMQLPHLHFNRIGVVPKGHNTGKWRVITDLSYPPGRSVNDGIDDEMCSLSYISVDQVAEVAASYGNGALLAKVDIESAYRLIPVHPQDRPLLGMQLNGEIYVDPMLPFGLCSAPKIFNAAADALAWILEQSGSHHIFHYLDDFAIVGPPNSPQCAEDLARLESTCRELGVPLAAHKREGPTTVLVFLGIEIDTRAGVLRLPPEKLQRLQVALTQWEKRTDCEHKELESLVGFLSHACKVVRSGRSFLRRMLNLLHEMQKPQHKSHPIRLNLEFRSDLQWWRMFVERWNGVSYLPHPSQLPQTEMASDASGNWGCGAWFDHSWFQVQWDPYSRALPIAVKELIPIILAAERWGHRWRGMQVVCHCDNQVVVAGLRSRTSKQEHIMHLLRCLVFIEARHQFHIKPEYINTSHNHLADDLSRNKLSSFLSKAPLADRHPTPPSPSLLALLLDTSLDWTSPRWRHQFKDILKEV